MGSPLTFRIPVSVLGETQEALAESGAEGFEGVVLWVARDPRDGVAEVLYAVTPPQIALQSEEGLAVTIPDWAVSDLISRLPDGTFIPIRVHSHPSEAYHSSTDDLNRILSHRGAISVVVPDFARGSLNLPSCSVNELGADFVWREWNPDEISGRFVVVE